MAQSTSRNDSSGGRPDRPRETGGAPLSGRVVLLPRLKERDRIASALERAGAKVLRASMTRTVPGEAAALEATARRIVAGEAAWLVLTSARTVEALAPYLHVPVPSTLRVAVVGPETARLAPVLVVELSVRVVARGGVHNSHRKGGVDLTCRRGWCRPNTPGRSDLDLICALWVVLPARVPALTASARSRGKASPIGTKVLASIARCCG